LRREKLRNEGCGTSYIHFLTAVQPFPHAFASTVSLKEAVGGISGTRSL
jgi:hypothetical protein